MEYAKKELLLNLCVVSFVLSLLYGLTAACMDRLAGSDASYISGPGGAAVFMLFFLLSYLVHIIISLWSYASAAIAGRPLFRRLVVFNVPGLLLICAIAFFAGSAVILAAVFTLLIFSIIMAVNTRKAR
ncbi:hypothetical protein [Paenibacillus tengchongensis]|uniref:hypothetical protein n=1 Tax=Paenibacillus tengchongensis TaxID=2608684 RepID=UPI00124E1D6B|nr:hypothetical protein [Paenibacillus tengchongensis]